MAKKVTTKPVSGSAKPAWGLAAGLLTGCAITLLGVMLQLEPETILLRALLGGAVTGMLVSVITHSLHMVTTSHEDE